MIVSVVFSLCRCLLLGGVRKIVFTFKFLRRASVAEYCVHRVWSWCSGRVFQCTINRLYVQDIVVFMYILHYWNICCLLAWHVPVIAVQILFQAALQFDRLSVCNCNSVLGSDLLPAECTENSTIVTAMCCSAVLQQVAACCSPTRLVAVTIALCSQSAKIKIKIKLKST